MEQNLTGFDCEDGVYDRIDLSFSSPIAINAFWCLRVIDVADGRFVLKFSYDEDLVAMVKTVPGRRWEDGRWTIPGNSEAALLIDRLTADHRFLATERSDMPLEKARKIAAPTPRAMTIEITGPKPPRSASRTTLTGSTRSKRFQDVVGSTMLAPKLGWSPSTRCPSTLSSRNFSSRHRLFRNTVWKRCATLARTAHQHSRCSTPHHYPAPAGSERQEVRGRMSPDAARAISSGQLTG